MESKCSAIFDLRSSHATDLTFYVLRFAGFGMDDCIFCEIAAGRASASVVHEDEIALVFMDIQPVNPGHMLIIPRRHATFLADLDEAAGAHLFRIGMRMAAALRRSGIRCEGVNMLLADG